MRRASWIALSMIVVAGIAPWPRVAALAAPDSAAGGGAAARPNAATAATTATPGAMTPERLMALIREAQRVQRADTLAWQRFRFRRTVLSERLEHDGTVKEATHLEFEIRPAGANAFEEILVRIDGRAPTVREIEERRADARFTRHYRTAVAGKDEEDMESGYSLATLLRLSHYHYAGVEDVGGAPAHRLDFEPDPTAGGSGIAARITQAMSGSLWLSVDGLHLVRARAVTNRPVTLFLGLSRVRSLEVGLEAAAVAPGVYLPREMSISTHASVLFAAIHRRQRFTYSDFTPYAAPAP